MRSGISAENTYLPAWINPVHSKEPKYDMDTAKKEAEMVMCGAVADLLEKTGEMAKVVALHTGHCESSTRASTRSCCYALSSITSAQSFASGAKGARLDSMPPSPPCRSP
jgi:hypothetical protein